MNTPRQTWDYLYPLVLGACLVLNTTILDPAWRWPLGLQVAAVLVLSVMTALVAPAPSMRRMSMGILLGVGIIYGSLRHGDDIGLHASWQRWVLGLVLSSPFLYLVFTSDPRRQRRSRAGQR